MKGASSKKCNGHDGLSNEMPKHGSPVFGQIFVWSFQNEHLGKKISESLKLAKPVPNLKKKEKKFLPRTKGEEICYVLLAKSLKNRS